MQDVTVTIDEGQRQMLLLALAKLSIERPGWHAALGDLAATFSTAPTIEDGREMYEQFRAIVPDINYTTVDAGTYRPVLQALAAHIGAALPNGWGFSLLLFEYGDRPDKSLFYISSAQREDVIAVMHEFIRRQTQ
jgi:hypothetical protein